MLFKIDKSTILGPFTGNPGIKQILSDSTFQKYFSDFCFQVLCEETNNKIEGYGLQTDSWPLIHLSAGRDETSSGQIMGEMRAACHFPEPLLAI